MDERTSAVDLDLYVEKRDLLSAKILLSGGTTIVDVVGALPSRCPKMMATSFASCPHLILHCFFTSR